MILHPGLFDDQDSDNEYLNIIVPIMAEIDVILICYDVRDTRIRKEDIEILKILQMQLGNHIWTKVIIVLTFSNLATSEQINGKISSIQKRFTKIIKEAKVPILAAGNKEKDWKFNIWNTIFQNSDRKLNSAILKITVDDLFETVKKKDKSTQENIYKKIMNDDSLPYKIKKQLKEKAGGCFNSFDFISVKLNGKIFKKQIIELKYGDCVLISNIECSKIYYIKHHKGPYKVYKIGSLWLTKNHLVYDNNKYIEAYKISNESKITYSVSNFITKSGYIYQNKYYSVFSNFHYIKQIISKFLQFFINI